MGVTDTMMELSDRATSRTSGTPQGFQETVLAVAARAKAALPEAADRIDTAAALVLAGEVELLDGGRTARVGSQSSGGPTYLVNGQCPCSEGPTTPGHFCTHRLAYGIAKRAIGLTQERQETLPAQTEPAAWAVPGESQDVEPSPMRSGVAPAAERREIPAQYLQLIDGKPFVKYAGLLAMAHAQGLQQLDARFAQVSDTLAVAHATATFTDGRRFTESGDATPENVGSQVRPHFARLALTRAKARCLRDALNIGLCAVEELGG
jgi:hypothetical protein